jgi:regulatory protein
MPSRSRLPRSAAPEGSPRTAALALLGRRDYTTRELSDKLQARGYPAEAVNAALRSLMADGLLDDRRVAAAYVRTASKVKGRGRIRIAHELHARGVVKSVIDDVLGRLEPEDESQAIQVILTKRRWPARPTLADRRRMFHHLLRRGFPPDVIAKAMRGDVE